jgi:chaperonin GroEL (HSP60 family)
LNSVAIEAFAEALEEIPFTLAQNAGMDAIKAVTQLRGKHQDQQKTFGIDVMNGRVSDMKSLNVWETLKNKQAQLSMAAELAIAILRIDDVIAL